MNPTASVLVGLGAALGAAGLALADLVSRRARRVPVPVRAPSGRRRR
ncbi:MAG: hypothetical protein U0Q07_10615 [Acidimicrobiales bacterium]